ncbi:MAG: hypothetical protein KDA20_05260 [Phycisphaerales bacterium]|nr:hypothetical protein [Phycisphaerales bacterium]
MTELQRNPGREHRGVLDIIRDLKSGVLDPCNLAPEERQLCVAHLNGEGLSVAEIAKVLKVSDRTVQRDRKAILQSNRLEHNPQLAGEYAGWLIAEAEATVSRLRRTARDRETPAAVKIEAEKACFDIRDRVIQRLQSLGFLPMATQRVHADLIHHTGEAQTLAEIQAEAQRLQEINAEFIDGDAKVIGDIESMEGGDLATCSP